MKIGLDGNEANIKDRVGSGKYAFELLKQFSQNGNHEFIIYLKDKPLDDLPKESKNLKYKVFGPQKLWTQFALPLKLLMDRKIEIFFSLSHYGPRFSNIKYCITIFDLSYLHFPQLFKKSDLYQLQKWSLYSIRNSSHIFAISNSTKNDMVGHLGVEPSKITVTYMGYDEKNFKPQSKDKITKIKKKYKISGDYLIFVGTLQPRKNIERMVEAFASILNSSKFAVHNKSAVNLSLVIVGKKGWMYDSLFAKVKDLNIENKVIFTGYVPDSYLSALISGAKIYVLPSLWEGFGIPVIEAQACGIPVVVSNVSSLPEIVGDSGLLIDPESTESIATGMHKVLVDQKLRHDLIKKGFLNIKRFSWQRCAQQTLAVLEKVASR